MTSTSSGRALSGNASRPGIFYGWVVVWAAFVLLMIVAGVTYSTPAMFRFFEPDFGIGRGQSAFIFAFSQVMAFLVGPAAGSLAEKHGPRVVAGGGLLLMSAGLLGAAMARSYVPLLLCYGLAIGVGSGAIYVPLLGLIQRWFYRRRGLASGVATTGVSIGTLSLPLASVAGADAFGWRSLYFILGALCLLIGGAAVFVLAADPRERGLNPDGDLEEAALQPAEEAKSGMTLRQALRDRQFYLLYYSCFGAAVMSFVAFVHLPQHFAEASQAPSQAATIISVIGLASLVARLGGGSWADRIGRVVMVRVALLIMLLASVLWSLNTANEAVFYGVAALIGVTYGLCIALLPTVIADSFGSAEVSRIIGAVYTSFALASLVGPTVGGLLRDLYGDYSLTLALCVFLSGTSVVASIGISRRF